MTNKEYLIRYLGISADLLSGIDASSVKGLKVGVPMWANLYTVYAWAGQQKVEKPDCKDSLERLEATCLLGAVEDFDKCVMSNPDNLKMFSEDFTWRWGDLFLEAGDLLVEGKFFPVDGEKAICLYNRAASISSIAGNYHCTLIGDVYYKGLGINPDYPKALEYYLLAEDNVRLGDYYSEGKAVPPDYHKAIQYYLQDLAHFDNDAFPRLQAIVCDKLVGCYARICDFDKVEEYAEKSNAFWQKVKE